LLEHGSLVEAFEPEVPVLLTFVVAGGMLASSHRAGEDEWWFNYLDRIEAQPYQFKWL